MSNETRVTVSCGIDGEYYAKLSQLIEYLTDTLNAIPEEYRNEARIDVTSKTAAYSDYQTVDWDVYYFRPETPEEELYRLAQEKVWAEQQKANARRMLEQAKKILGED